MVNNNQQQRNKNNGNYKNMPILLGLRSDYSKELVGALSPVNHKDIRARL